MEIRDPERTSRFWIGTRCDRSYINDYHDDDDDHIDVDDNNDDIDDDDDDD